MKQLIIILFFLPYLSFSQNGNIKSAFKWKVADPSTVGISAERLQHIDKICQEAIDDGDVPGILALIAKDGAIVYEKTFGVSDIGTGEELRSDHIFRIASQTKAITSTAVMMLWEEGHFQLDDPISRWIPEFAETGVLKDFRYGDTSFTTTPVKSPITIRHLLTHTAGIGYGAIDGDERMQMIYAKAGIREIASMTPLTTEENIKNLAKLPLHFHPGERYQYSMGLDVLGYFIEVVSGQRFDEFLHDRLFEPLGMTDTYFYLPTDKNDRLLPIHVPGEEGWVASDPAKDGFTGFPIDGSRTLHSGGGGLSSTARDYARFLQMYLNRGEFAGHRVLSPKTVDLIMGNHIKDFWGDGGSHYGLAFGVVDQKGEDLGGQGASGTFSWGGAFNTQYFADPQNDMIGIIMKQTLYQRKDKTGWQFRQLVGQSLSAPSGPELSVADPESKGMSGKKLSRIDAVCEEAITDKNIPGAVALVVKDGSVVYHKAFGHADSEMSKTLHKSDIFRIASQTKAITATAVMMLWEEGHFQLDDPISRWIPEFKDAKVLSRFRYADTTFSSKPANKQISIRHLLTHTSGIGYGFIDPDERMKMLYRKAGVQEIAAQDDLTTAENVKRIASMPLHFEPGEKPLYGMGLDVLAYFVEIVSGQSFDQFVKARILDPLGMKDTHFHLPAEKADRLVSIQIKEGEQWANQPVTGYDPSYPLTGNRGFCAGGAGLVSTAIDYAKFLQMYLNDGNYNGKQLLSPSTIDAIMGDHSDDFWGRPGRGHGLVFGLVDETGEGLGGEGSDGTFDWGGYFNTQYFADPETGVIGILYKQTLGNTGDQTGWKFRQVVSHAVNE